MQIEVQGTESILRDISIIFGELLRISGYLEGPRFGTMDSGNLINYVKDSRIVSVQLTEESESDGSALRVETEAEIPELNELWDSALITYGKRLKMKLSNYAINKEKVEQGTR